MKIRYLQDKQGQKPDGSFAKGGVVFATGTPVANTIAETWTMMRYLQPDELKRRGLESFDAWAKTYGQISSGIEQTAAGKYKAGPAVRAVREPAGAQQAIPERDRHQSCLRGPRNDGGSAPSG